MTRKFFFVACLILFSTTTVSVSAESLGDKKNFYIDSGYDLNSRKELTAILVKKTNDVNFYADQNWWNFTFQESANNSLDILAKEYRTNIYPVLIVAYGSEANPGIDGESAITVLIHPMKKNAGGYFRSNDEYSKILISDSNEREMVYLNSEYIESDLAKSLLAHELVHLITFNQKENENNVLEEIWLNELRAEYAPTLIGYDNDFETSNLKRRMQDFSENPSESLIEWRGDKSNYGGINLFAQYMVDHYGIKILTDSLQSGLVGIKSLNYALAKNNFKETFSEIFTDWTIAVLINDCNYGAKYCYLNQNLKNFHINPKINFLPLAGESTLTLSDITESWAGNWYKVIGGNGDLTFRFNGSEGGDFKVPYIISNNSGSYNIGFMEPGKDFLIKNFGEDIKSFFLLPTVKNLENRKPFYSFSWSVTNKKEENPDLIIASLLAQIETLKNQISVMQAKINAILAGNNNSSETACNISGAIYYGQTGAGVKCLQEFLKSQGADIYPEGLVTGYFGNLTKAAIIRFQEKYSDDILTPLGLRAGTGFMGAKTKAKIEDLLTNRL